MSVAVSSWVWKHSKAKGNSRLVLLAIADCADDTGGNAWPSIPTIADKAGVSERTAIRCIADLCALGELHRIHQGGRRGRGGTTNGYRVLMPSSDTPDSGDKLAVVTPEVESGDKSGRSGDKGGTRTVPRTKNRPSGKRIVTDPPEMMDVTEGMRAWAAKEGITVDVDAETPRFLDWHRSKGNRMKDWGAAWRNWMRNTRQFSSPNAKTKTRDQFSAPSL